jgi:hypothetical protein
MDTSSSGAEPYIRVDVHSLAGAGRFVGRLGESLDGAGRLVQRQTQDGLAAIPPSDLFEAYAFCWGRWSAVLDAAQRAITAAGGALGAGAAHFQHVDDTAGNGVRATAN